MQRLTVDPAKLVFPDRCVRCGSLPRSAYALRAGARAVHVPLCASCSTRLTSSRVMFVIGALVLGVVFVVLSALFLEAVVPFPEDAARRTLVAGVVALALLAIAIASVVVAVRTALAAHLARWAPVFVIAVRRSSVELAIRDDGLARDVARLSGPIAADADGTYREASAVLTPFRPGMYGAWILPAVLSLGGFGGAFVRWSEIGRAETQGRTLSMSWIEWTAYDVGGRAGVTVFLVGVGVGFVAVAIAAWRASRAR